MLRSRIETGLGVLATLLAVASLVWPTWLESLTRLEPDGGNGGAEWWLAVVFGVVALAFFVLARRDRRSARAALARAALARAE